MLSFPLEQNNHRFPAMPISSTPSLPKIYTPPPPPPNLIFPLIKRPRHPLIFRPHKIRKRLRLLILIMPMRMIVRVRVVRRADVFHSVDGTAFGTAFDRAGAGHLVWYGLVGEGGEGKKGEGLYGDARRARGLRGSRRDSRCSRRVVRRRLSLRRWGCRGFLGGEGGGLADCSVWGLDWRFWMCRWCFCGGLEEMVGMMAGCVRVVSFLSTTTAHDASTVLRKWQCSVPFLEASNGLISNTSTPCIFPNISNRSNPVACSTSVGTVPGSAPVGRRSCSDLTSVTDGNQSFGVV